MSKQKRNNSHEPFLEFIDDSDLEVADTNGFPGLITLHSKREPLIIKETEYKGNHRISLRFHYHDKRDGVLRPGRRGIAIPLEAAKLVAQAILDLMEIIEKEEPED